MMKIKILFLLISLSLQELAFSQSDPTTIDSLAKAFTCSKCNKLEQFSKALVEPYSNPRDKSRAIFAWIATHVRYDYKEAQTLDKKIRFTGSSVAEVEQKQKKYYEEEIPNVTFRTRKGICQDYSYLFKQMCSFVGIEAEVIPGLSKDDTKRVSKVGHAWNAVKLDGAWYLLDATWAAGHLDKKKFIKAYSPGYYMADPQLFVLNHLPDDPKWQLLEKPIELPEFKKQPWLNYGQYKFPIEKVLPLGVPLLKQGEQVSISFKFKSAAPFLMVLGRNDKPIPFKESAQDGYTTLKFNPKSNAEIEVVVSKTKKGTWMRLAKFYVD